ncbi:MAG: 50S ribosomal protein L32 [Candidatus Portnoybacteria bacterium]|nr:50S ribosomal protein L32 [Candidatus Portnoybacteria bacterium]
MPVPKQKTSRKRRGDRRKHLALKPLSLTACSHCNAQILPHRVCPECGYYRGRSVIEIEDKKARGKKEKEKEKPAVLPEEPKTKTAPEKPLSVEELSKKSD